ncbi:hypothetical protein B932_1814 [Gluconobacter oxydans H24]|nr:hypothetical protein B932_1814 [Gluconobacter oxydans H24]
MTSVSNHALMSRDDLRTRDRNASANAVPDCPFPGNAAFGGGD